MLYNLVKLIGLIVRQFFLPNPFEAMWPKQALALNWVSGGILLLISYYITGLLYCRGDGAAFGSLLFNIVYMVLTLLLWGILEVVRIVIDNLIIAAITAGVLLVLVTAVVLTIRYFKKRRLMPENP